MASRSTSLILVLVRYLHATAVPLVLLLGSIAALATFGPSQEVELPDVAARAEPAGPAPAADKKPAAVADLYGDPLPQGAVARLGTVRFRHDSQTYGLAFTPDAKLLAGTTGSEVILWDATTGRELQRLSRRVGSLDNGGAMDISPDGSTLALLGTTRRGDPPELSLWDLQRGTRARTLALPAANDPLLGLRDGSRLRYAPDGKTLVVIRAGQFLVFDVAKGELQASFGKMVNANGLALSPDNRTLAIATFRACVQLWDISKGEMSRELDDADKKFATAVAFAPDGKVLAWGTWDRITLSDPATGNQLARLEAKMQSINGLGFTPDGKKLVSGSQDGCVRVWEVTTGKLLLTLNSGMTGRALALSRDGTTAALGTAGSAVRLWQVATGKELFTEFQGHDAWVNCLAFSPDGKTLASGEFYHQIRLWDVASRRSSRVLPGRAWSLSFSPDARRLASVPRSRTVDIWDTDSGKKAMVIKVPDADDVRSAMFSVDGRRLVTLDKNHGKDGRSAWEPHRLRHWDAATGKEEKSWTVPGHMHSPVVSRDGMSVLVGDGGSVRFHDVRSGRARVFHSSAKSYPQALAGSSDSRLLASGDTSGDLAVRLWEIATGKEIQVLKGHACPVTCAVWFPGGRIVAAADDNKSYGGDYGTNTVRLWDTVTGQELARFGGLGTVVTSLAISPDGAHLAGGLHDSTILVWDVRPAAAALKDAERHLEPADLERCWQDLAGDDARKAHQALWSLRAAPNQSVPFLAARLQPIALADAHKVKQWLADLESDQFATRQSAVKELILVGEQVVPALHEALKGNVPLESRRRLEQIVNALADVPGAATLRAIRAIMTLESIGTSDAKRVLEKLARGAPGARETEEAKASLERLDGDSP